MKTGLKPQLLVIALVFCAIGCELMRGKVNADNLCNCDVAQEKMDTTISLGRDGSKITDLAQRFTIGNQNQTITKMRLNLHTNNGYAAPLRLTIYPHNASLNAPDTSSGSIAVSTNTVTAATSATWVDFCFSFDCASTSVTLSAANSYWAVINRPTDYANFSPTNYYSFSADNSGTFLGLIKNFNFSSPNAWVTTDAAAASLANHSIALRIGCDSANTACN